MNITINPCFNRTKGGVLFVKKSYQEKMIVKEWIVFALIDLMKKQSFQNISITNLAKKAGIPRSTFYRYFNDKEEVLLEYSNYLTELLAKEYRDLKPQNHFDSLYILFSFLEQNNEYLKTLVNNKKEYIILNTINQNIKSMNLNTRNQLFVRYQSGGLYNVIIEWIQSNFQPSPEDITNNVCMIMNNQLIQESSSRYANTFHKL